MSTTDLAPADTTTSVELGPQVPTPDGGRIQLALNVDDLTEAR